YTIHSRTASHTPPHLPSFPTRRSSDLEAGLARRAHGGRHGLEIESAHGTFVLHLCEEKPTDQGREVADPVEYGRAGGGPPTLHRSEEHTSELQSLRHLVCRLLLEKKKK